MVNVTLNTEQQLYVLDHGRGYSCFGFANAHDHANQMAERLKRPDLAFGEADFGTLSGYQKYLAAVEAWGKSLLSRKTYFDPATDPKAARVLERCREANAKVRLILGDTATARTWLDEHDVVGRIGRSTGTLKVPLLIEPGADGGIAILTAYLLAIIDWESGEFLFRHPRYRAPDLLIRPGEDADRPWEVLHDEQVVACFPDIGKAGAYVAFMRGETVEPRIFQ
ncbi:hypothetical protein HNP55_002906 [Paucibacter oligotrophus]|uniref:Uncharacterized protein n=1 Tax=Roseateles oligotrophus TaxID=1769250 RepID=A0A840L856_9BURK|nr:hypothetical protein [Roseateles oligotrophus]MBB4844370.1 hypothetical protein [Roseateles oligotrophus]